MIRGWLPIFCLAGSCGTAAPLHLAQQTWRELEAPAFVLISDAPEKEMLPLADALQQFSSLFAGMANAQGWEQQRPLVFYFATKADFLKLSRLRNTDGYFVDLLDLNVIALHRMSRREPPVESILFHEYTHYLNRFGRFRLPVWLDEGLAELFSTVAVNPETLRVASPAWRAIALNDIRHLPLEELLAATRRSAHYNEGNRQGIFYAKSWLFTHYLFMSTGKPDPRFATLIRDIQQGAEPASALTNLFGITLASLEPELLRYAQDERFNWVELRRKTMPDPAQFRVHKLNQSGALRRLGQLQLATDPDAAAEFFTRMLEKEPESPTAHVELGRAALFQQRFDEAERRLDQALALDERNVEALYLRALTALVAGGLATEILNHAERAIKEDPNHWGAHRLFAVAAGQIGARMDDAIASTLKVLASHPNDGETLVLLAELYAMQSPPRIDETLVARLAQIAQAKHQHTEQGLELIEMARETLAKIEQIKQRATTDREAAAGR